MSRARTSPALSTRSVSVLVESLCSLSGICFRLRMMSVASSTTPGIGENSWSTPSIFTAVIAAPSIEESSTRRSALPIVVPKPRSKGCAQNRPYLSVWVSVSTARRLGFWKPFQSICFSPPVPMAQGNTLSAQKGLRCTRLFGPGWWAESCELLAVQFDDQLLVDGQVEVFALRQSLYASLQAFAINFQPRRRRLMAVVFHRSLDRLRVLRLIAYNHFIAGLHFIRRNGDLAAIHGDVAVTH